MEEYKSIEEFDPFSVPEFRDNMRKALEEDSIITDKKIPQCPSKEECKLSQEFFNNDMILANLIEEYTPKFMYEYKPKGLVVSVEIQQSFSKENIELLRNHIADILYKLSELIPNCNYM